MTKKQDSEPIEQENEVHEEDNSLEIHIKELENQLKRALADYQNLEKRVQEERKEWIKAANKEILLRLLPVLDTLMLASKHSEDKNIQVSVAQFLDILKSEGVERIKTEGQEFDPALMEAVTTAPGPEGKVVDEIRAGYRLYDKILRVAQVIVGNGEK